MSMVCPFRAMVESRTSVLRTSSDGCTMTVEIRREKPEDIDGISRVVAKAFGRNLEAGLVTLIRSREQSLLSLVATENGEIVGHVMVSPIEITPAQQGDFGAVAPLSVLPRDQAKGIGSALMYAMIKQSRDLGFDALFLLGSPGYYPRFGFSPSHLDNEYGATDAFMQLELVQGCLETVKGKAVYVSAFGESGA